MRSQDNAFLCNAQCFSGRSGSFGAGQKLIWFNGRNGLWRFEQWHSRRYTPELHLTLHIAAPLRLKLWRSSRNESTRVLSMQLLRLWNRRLTRDWSDGPDVNLETGWHQHDNNTSRKKTFGIVCLVLICGQGSINSTQRVEAFELQSQWNFESWTDQNSCGFWVVWFSFWFAAKEFVKAPSAELREAALLSHFESRMMYRKDLYL